VQARVWGILTSEGGNLRESLWEREIKRRGGDKDTFSICYWRGKRSHFLGETRKNNGVATTFSGRRRRLRIWKREKVT